MISWAAAGAVVAADNTIYMHMQRPSLVGAIVGGEHVRLCAAGRESVRVVGEQRRRHASISPPPRHTAPAHPSPHSFIGRLVQHGWELVALSQGSRNCAFPDPHQYIACESSPLIPPLRSLASF